MKKVDRTGYIRKMNNGQLARIIIYRSSKDIDVQFLKDGTIIEHVDYQNFKKGKIANRTEEKEKIKSRKNEKKIMKCGLEGEITEYRSSTDIDVKLSDGTLLRYVTYDEFKRGTLNPSSNKNKHTKNNLLGTRLITNCGDIAEVIEIINSQNVVVKFDHGDFIKRCRTKDFKKGIVENPYFSKTEKQKRERLNKSKKMNNGTHATISNYENSRNVDIKFEDGTVIKNRSYADFKNGCVKNKNLKNANLRDDREGSVAIMNCGVECKIKKYENANSIEVEFPDGRVLTNRTYDEFLRGSIKHPDYNSIYNTSRNEFLLQYLFEPYGFKKAQKGSLKELGLGDFELDLYNPNFNGVKIAIEYDGYFIRKDKGHTQERDLEKDRRCKNAGIILFRIREPQLPMLNSSSKIFLCNSDKIFSKDLLETINLLITHINKYYNGNIELIKKIDRAAILKEYANKFYRTNSQSDKIGIRLRMNNGMMAEIVEYRSYNDIDVLFDDGYLAINKRYSNFIKGNIGNPNIKKTKSKKINQDKINRFKIKRREKI